MERFPIVIFPLLYVHEFFSSWKFWLVLFQLFIHNQINSWYNNIILALMFDSEEEDIQYD